MFRLAMASAAILLGSTVATAGDNPKDSTASGEPVTCKKVVTAESGTKPFDMCLTKAQWAAKKRADAKNPNRIVCRYEQASGTRFKSYKICMTAAEWDNQRHLERQAIDNLQARTCVQGGGC